MWVVVLIFLAALWAIALVISLLWRWKPPGNKVHRPMESPAGKP